MSLETLRQSYHIAPGIYDEMADYSGAIRPQWQGLLKHLGSLESHELYNSWRQALRLIHENGVTYNVYGDPAGMDRPWQLDAIPLLIAAQEWQDISAGLTQRALLLDLILNDLYGAQRLLHEGVIPPELVFANPAFLRPCCNLPLYGQRRLVHYAADLGRGPDGRMWIIGDRTQTPSGAGYALENRIVISRALPDVFRDCSVQRLAGFFRSMRQTIKAIAPHNKDNPRIVLLTPGPYNETYFEHAYLARYLGYTLVEGADLTVRDNTVYLKTLGGLQQVDVILRRQDDSFCDPLELRPDSSLGIPGLLQALYSGNVAIANALGTGLVDARALMPLLPRLCRYFLGQDLLLASATTYWCGDPTSLTFVLENLPRLVIKPAFRLAHTAPIFGDKLTSTQLDDLRARLRAQPADFVGQDKVEFSTAPILSGNNLEPRHIVLRAHLVAADDSYAVMPGGLVRFAGPDDSTIVSMQSGGGSKDAWVLSAGPVDTFSLLQPPGHAIALSRAGGDLPSRVADNLFWLGRYMERAEGLVRLARAIIVRLLDQGPENTEETALLVSALPPPLLDPAKPAQKLVTPQERLVQCLLDPTHPAGLTADLIAVHRVARIVRDRISIDTWRIIAGFTQDFMNPRSPDQGAPVLDLNEILAGLDRLIIWFAAFGGLAMESMTRGHAWRFQDMGRRIERAAHTTALLGHTLVPPASRQVQILEAVLEVADSAMTYRRRYMTSLQVAPVLDLLLADESNPRSVAFQLARLMEHIEELPHSASNPGRTQEERFVLRALTDLRLLDISAELGPVELGPRPNLANILERTTGHLGAVAESLSQSYLSHALVSRQLGAIFGES